MTLKGPYASDYPSRETALAIVEAMQDPAHRWQDVERLTGLGDAALYVADRCWMVYGLPELDPGNVARWIAEASMRPRKPVTTTPTPTMTTTNEPHPGFNFRKD